MITKMKFAFFLLFMCIGIITIAQITYPGQRPGKAVVVAAQGEISLENEVLKITFRSSGNAIGPIGFQDKTARQMVKFPSKAPLFSFNLRDGTTWSSNDFTMQGNITSSEVVVRPAEAVMSKRIQGKKLLARFENATTGLSVTWEAELRNGSNYVRQIFTFASRRNIDISKFTMISLPTSFKSEQVGMVDGSPMVY